MSANDHTVPKLSLVRIGAGDNGTLGNPTYLDFYIHSLDMNPNTNLENYMTDTIKQESDACQVCNFDLIYSSTENATLAGRPAFQIVYSTLTLEDPPKLHKTMITGTIIGNSLYKAYYRAFVPDFSTYSDTVKKMIDSIQIDPTL